MELLVQEPVNRELHIHVLPEQRIIIGHLPVRRTTVPVLHAVLLIQGQTPAEQALFLIQIRRDPVAQQLHPEAVRIVINRQTATIPIQEVTPGLRLQPLPEVAMQQEDLLRGEVIIPEVRPQVQTKAVILVRQVHQVLPQGVVIQDREAAPVRRARSAVHHRVPAQDRAVLPEVVVQALRVQEEGRRVVC
jgi:hypothetical protein